VISRRIWPKTPWRRSSTTPTTRAGAARGGRTWPIRRPCANAPSGGDAGIERAPNNDSVSANGELVSAMESANISNAGVSMPSKMTNRRLLLMTAPPGADSMPSVRSRYVLKYTGRREVRPVCAKIESALSDIGQPTLDDNCQRAGGGRKNWKWRKLQRGGARTLAELLFLGYF
jgi:hypothetical protein